MSRQAGVNPGGIRGAGLIEVAISLLLISVGTLGLAGLQLSAKRMGYEAVQRSAAATMAVDLLERMRANRGALESYRVAGLGAAAGGRLPDPLTACDLLPCSPVQRAFFDLWEWERALNGELTSASTGGLVQPLACVAIEGRRVLVEINWLGREDPDYPVAGRNCGAADQLPDGGGRQRLRMSSWVAEH
ncbi:type IV pilus modification protein PilV [Pseudomonadota bacterium]